MTAENPNSGDSVDTSAVERFLQTETGGRAGTGIAAVILFVVPVVWSLFQLWIASPLPYIFEIGLLNSTQERSIHLAFATFLAFAAFPMFKGRQANPNAVPVYDWILALVAAFSSAYLYLFYDQLATRPGAPILQDLIVAMVGLVLLLEATRRALGLPLTIVAGVFILVMIPVIYSYLYFKKGNT